MTILDDTSKAASGLTRRSVSPRSVRDRFLALRDKGLTNPRVIRWLERFPLTRPVARRKAAQLFDICSGFVYSQVLFACVELNLFEVLKAEPSTPETLSNKLGLSRDAVQRLLTAAVALDLVEARSQGRYGLGQLGSAMIASPGLMAMVHHHAVLYRDLADPVALLRGAVKSGMSDFWPYAVASSSAEGGVGDYSSLMAATQPALAREILDAYDFAQHRKVMDVGGGNGTFIIHAAARAPATSFVLFDLSEVAELAAENFAAAGLSSRVEIAAGSFLADTLPAGADLITLIRVILDHDDDTALSILKAVRQALPPGGVLLLAEAMADTRVAPKVGAYFSFYLMAMGRGRPRTEAELRRLLREAGFSRVASRATCQPLLTRILLARH